MGEGASAGSAASVDHPRILDMTNTPNATHLAASFLAASSVHAAPADLGDRLLAMLLAARATHPRIHLDDQRFVRHLARHLPDGAALDAWLGSICADDLYLACACADGIPAALEALDRQHLSQVGRYLTALRPTPDFVDDVAQAVREHLLVGAGGHTPRIARYSGSGPLGGWLRVVTVRRAIAARRPRTERLAGDDEERAHAEATPVNPETDFFERRYAGELAAALRAAIGALEPKQRDLLRMHFKEGATLKQLVATSGQSKATVYRRIEAARKEILAGVRRRLGDRLGLGAAEQDSLMGLLRSRLDISLSSAFREPADRSPGTGEGIPGIN
jgi:RNA polymerase sigma-70 factor, ECF subfamily